MANARVDTLLSCMPEAPNLIAPVSDVVFAELSVAGTTAKPFWLALPLSVWLIDELASNNGSCESDFAFNVV